MAKNNAEETLNSSISPEIDNFSESSFYVKLIDLGFESNVASKLDELSLSGKLPLANLDESVIQILKGFPADEALDILTQYADTNFEDFYTKSAYLYKIMQTYIPGQQTTGFIPNNHPAEERIRDILKRTGYTLDVTEGQRKYGGPPPDWNAPPPHPGCQVYCGRIPGDMLEDELIVLFGQLGKIWSLRLMMDRFTGFNRGYAFITYTNKSEALRAIEELNNYEIRPCKFIRVNFSSSANQRLFIGNIPKSKSKEEIMQKFARYTDGLSGVIVYPTRDGKKNNRGFAFLDFESHRAASLAKRWLGNRGFTVWGFNIVVDWADPQDKPNSEIMERVKVLYVSNIAEECSIEELSEAFKVYGNVTRTVKIKSFAFIHFNERSHAIRAMEELNNTEIRGSLIEVSLAKPSTDLITKNKINRAKEHRIMQHNSERYTMQPTNIIPLWCNVGPIPYHQMYMQMNTDILRTAFEQNDQGYYGQRVSF